MYKLENGEFIKIPDTPESKKVEEGWKESRKELGRIYKSLKKSREMYFQPLVKDIYKELKDGGFLHEYYNSFLYFYYITLRRFLLESTKWIDYEHSEDSKKQRRDIIKTLIFIKRIMHNEEDYHWGEKSYLWKFRFRFWQFMAFRLLQKDSLFGLWF